MGHSAVRLSGGVFCARPRVLQSRDSSPCHSLLRQLWDGSGIDPQLAVGTYIDFNVKFLLVFGFAFELPLALTLLARIGVLSSRVLASYRKHAILVALILSAIITPDATLFTMLLDGRACSIILYEIGIWGCAILREAASQ